MIDEEKRRAVREKEMGRLEFRAEFEAPKGRLKRMYAFITRWCALFVNIQDFALAIIAILWFYDWKFVTPVLEHQMRVTNSWTRIYQRLVKAERGVA